MTEGDQAPTIMRAGLVGTGFISEHHVSALRRLPGVELVGIHDLDATRAAAAASRFGVPDLGSIDGLVGAGADVIHVLTPPAVHADVAIAALERGCHVLVEKPLADDVAKCDEIERAARVNDRRVCVDHSLLFDPAFRRALTAVREGRLGRIVTVDVIRSAEFPAWGGGPLPPQYRDAGYAFRDQAVHAIYLLEALLGPVEDIEAEWSGLGHADPNLPFDEWRARIACRDGVAGYRLSWNVRPLQNQLVIHGTDGVLRVDLFLMFNGLRRSIPQLPRAAERIVSAVGDLAAPLVDVGRYSWAFARGRAVPYQGLHELVAAYYASLRAGAPPPVTIAEARRVVQWVEAVARRADAEHRDALARLERSPSADVLVTGASGTLGRAVVDRLVDQDRTVRALVRRLPADLPDGVEVVVGDLGDDAAVDRAVAGASAVVHAGAAMRGPASEHDRSTVVGTRNVVDACVRHGVERLVHVSSLSVLDWTHGHDGDQLTEGAPLEPMPRRRGDYTRAKQEAERIVRAAEASSGLPVTILRPGELFSGSQPHATSSVARRVGGRWIVLGDGEAIVPYVHVDDAADAVVLALDQRSPGGIFHLVGEEHTQNVMLARSLDPRSRVVWVPARAARGAARALEALFGRIGRRSPVTARQVRCSTARRSFATRRAREALGWTPIGSESIDLRERPEPTSAEPAVEQVAG